MSGNRVKLSKTVLDAVSAAMLILEADSNFDCLVSFSGSIDVFADDKQVGVIQGEGFDWCFTAITSSNDTAESDGAK
jgi:hypothetical protein